MSKVIKVVIDGVEHKVGDLGGEVKVIVEDGDLTREIAFNEDGASENVLRDDDWLNDASSSYGELFGNESDDFEDEEDEDEDEDVCCDCGEYFYECTCDEGDEDEGSEDDEPWSPDDVVSLTEPIDAEAMPF